MRKSTLSESTKMFCMNCGKEGIPVVRKRSKQKEKFHRKKMYCWHCGTEVNHIECRNEFEIKEFKENFIMGAFKEEAEESMKISKEHNIFSLLEAK